MDIDIAVLFRAVEGVVTFVIVGCLGYFLAKRAWFSGDSLGLVSKLTTFVAIPAYLFYNITTTFTRDELLAMAPGVVPPFACIGICMAIGWILARLMKSRNTGLFIAGFAFSNSINIGLPINLVLFGEEGVPYVLLYFIANTILFWSVGNVLIANNVPGAAAKNSLGQNLTKVFSPPTLAFLIGATVVILQVPVPHVLSRSIQMVGSMNSALIMITLGATIFQMGLAGLKLDREVLLITCGRFVVSPLIMILLSLAIPMPPLMRNVFIIQSCMPVMTNSAMLAIYYKGDVEYATRSVCLTTIVSIITIPMYMVIAEGLRW